MGSTGVQGQSGGRCDLTRALPYFRIGSWGVCCRGIVLGGRRKVWWREEGRERTNGVDWDVDGSWENKTEKMRGKGEGTAIFIQKFV